MPFDFEVDVIARHPESGSDIVAHLNPIATPPDQRQFAFNPGVLVRMVLDRDSVVESVIVTLDGPRVRWPLTIRVTQEGSLLRCAAPGQYAVYGFDRIQGWRIDDTFTVEPGSADQVVTLLARPAEYWYCTFALRGKVPDSIVGATAFLHPVESLRPGKWSQAAQWTEQGELIFYPVSRGKYRLDPTGFRAIQGDVDVITGKDVDQQYEVDMDGTTFWIELMNN